MTHINNDERRRRIGVRHRLAPGSRASSQMEAAASMVALHATDPRLDRRIVTSRGTSYEGTISVASKVAFHLALDGHIGRDRPRGTWISGQFR